VLLENAGCRIQEKTNGIFGIVGTECGSGALSALYKGAGLSQGILIAL